MEKFVLIDGNSLANRAFYALPPLNNSSGVPTQAVYGFANMLIKAIEDIKPKFLAVAFDLPKPTFRHELCQDYKANRKGMPEDLAVQMPILKAMLSIMGITIIEKGGFEADDIIGTMAQKSGVETYIITGDRDALQLINSKTKVMLTKRGLSEIVVLDEKKLMDEFSLSPQQVIDYKALCGDASDNIPGVAGVGDKTATSLINSYKSLDGVYSNIDQISGKLKDKLIAGKDSAYLSYKLATIDTNVDLPINHSDCTFSYPFSENVKLFFIDNSFKTLVKRGEIFSAYGEDNLGQTISETKKSPCTIVNIDSEWAFDELLGKMDSQIAVYIDDSVHIAYDELTEYIVNINFSLIDMGLSLDIVIAKLMQAMQNAQIQKLIFDVKLMNKKFFKNIQGFFDIRLAHYLLENNGEKSLVELLQEYNIPENEKASGIIYISQILKTGLEKNNISKLYYDLEAPLSEVLYRMEQTGFHIDIARLNELGAVYSQKVSSLADEIYMLANQQFNINSPKQLAKVLFEDMQIAYPKKTTSYSTAAEILELIENENPIVKKVLYYRFLTKLNSTYVEGLKKAADLSGVVHTEFKQTLTSTGRLSSVEPNLQNIPIREDEGRELRSAFVPSKGNILVSADYSQIELRLLAHLSMDERMMQAYQNNEDIHASTAAEVFGVDKSAVTQKMRRDAKAVNFGIVYGISDYGLAKNLGISPHIARQYIAKYFERFSGVKQYLDKSVEDAKKCGYAVTLLGRTRKIPELYSPNFNMRSFGERVAKNMPLQGSAADIIKIAMLNVDKALQGKGSKLILQVHDELIIDTLESESDEVMKILKREMENAYKLNVPLVADVGIGKNWLICK